jgi:D-alanine--poly(phosphoribitol) ligase subunit 2
MIAALSDKLLDLLVSVTGTDEVRTNLDLSLYDYQVLDSIKTVELMLAIEEEFGVKISPAEFEREQWKSPREIIADVERRLQP